MTHVFATNVRLYRKRLGLSQEAFAERCHLHRTYISMLEREQRNISLKNVQAIADALDVEAYRLFIPPDNPPDGSGTAGVLPSRDKPAPQD